MMYSNENINLGLHHFQGSDASFQGVESVDDQAPLVYTQIMRPPYLTGFSAPPIMSISKTVN